MKHLTEIKRWTVSRQAKNSHRQLLIVELSFKDALNCFNTLGLNRHNTLVFSEAKEWINNSGDFDAPLIEPKKFKQYLGSSVQNIIYDASFGIDLNVLYGICGQVSAPGLIIIFFNQHHCSKKLLTAVPTSFGFEVHIDAVKTLLLNNADEQTGFISSTVCNLPKVKGIKLRNLNSFDNRPTIDETKYSTLKAFNLDQTDLVISNEQQSIFNIVLSEFKYTDRTQTKASNIHCILGERGRGKSTVLGLLLFESVISIPSNQKIKVTSLHRQNLIEVSNVYAKLQKGSNGSQKDNPRFEDLYAAPDYINEKSDPIELLIIDEIASLAPDLVKTLISKSEFTILSGTTSGYEGSGRGFTTRLLPFLREHENVRCHFLNRPFRWHNDDPVENYFKRILAQTVRQDDQISLPLDRKEHQNIDLPAITFKECDRSELLDNHELYCSVFSLLFEAHYQTNPNDIVRILNATECRLFIAIYQDTIVGAITTFFEGSQLLKPYALDISLNNRRLQGHLSAQGLSTTILEPYLASCNYWRVNRIAVRAKYRRQKVGRFMLEQLYQLALQNNVDALTSSFGFEPSLFNFWSNNKFLLVKLGKRIDTSSGSASVVVLKPVSSNIMPYLNTLKSCVYVNLYYYQQHFPRLKKIYKPLYKNNLQDIQALHLDIEKFALSLCQKWIKNGNLKQVRFEELAPFLCFILKSKYKEDHLNYQKIDMLFEKLVQGGLHKHERTNIQIELLDMTIPIISKKQF